MAKYKRSDAVRDLKRIWRRMDRRIEKRALRRMTESEIAELIQRYRREKRKARK